MVPKGMIEINEHALAMWGVELVGGNWMALLARTDVEGVLELTYRFRWYRDDIIGPDTQDVFRGERRRGRVPEAEGIKTLRALWDELRAAVPGHGAWELLRGARSLEEFGDALTAMPGMHTRVEAA
jgi:hypothetical protein